MERASTNLQITVAGVAVMLVFGGFIWFGWPSAEAPATSTSVVASIDSQRLTVHVSGAVINPGVVEVEAGARVAQAVSAAGGATSSARLGDMNLAAQLSDGDHIVVPSVGEGVSDASSDATGIDLNTASASELETLPGVGSVLAERIVAFRDAHGRFSTVEDLLDVSGIGEAKLAQMREAISSP